MDIAIRQQEILAIIGPNGAGKTTALELLLGLQTADSGKVHYWSDDYKKHLGVQLQSVPFFPGLSAIENLKLFAAFYKQVIATNEALAMLNKCGLRDSAYTEAGKLSGGQQKRLAIAAALAHQPELLVLDEPSAALDPRARQDIHQLIQLLHNEGNTVVFTSHDMDEVQRLAHRIIMVVQGDIVAQGTPEELCREHRVASLEHLYLKLSAKEETA
ncbi:ABC transporter ATP-binding protein [Cytobacillus purgationiresistens]